jgi:hypothetical protein
VPFDSGVPDNNVTAKTVPSPPDYSIKVNGGTGIVVIGNTTIRFGQNNLRLPTDHAVKFSVEVQAGSIMYVAALLDDGKDTKFETTYDSNTGVQNVPET